MRERCKTIMTTLTCSVLLLSVFGCTGSRVGVRTSPEPRYRVQEKTGPPAHAPAHGYRKKYAYRYYPSSHVYYDAGRRLYFYLDGGSWQAGVSLPSSIQLDFGETVSIHMDTDTPYVEFETHKAKYPSKKAGKGKAKGKGKGKPKGQAKEKKQ